MDVEEKPGARLTGATPTGAAPVGRLKTGKANADALKVVLMVPGLTGML
jgi:hypothetical protein